ncbi:amidohydrolase [Streptomyces zhihengii]
MEPETVTAPDAPAPTPALPSLRPALELYLDLHTHPELSGHEHRTADRLAGWLHDHGCAVTRGVGGGHGTVGVLANGPGPTVMLRAELDALPVTERTGLPYASTVPGVMHACGHDLHLAAAAGALGSLAAARDTWRGTVVLVGQPAEETLDGARAMLADGLYERFGTPDAVLAQHTAPLPAGAVAHAGHGPLMPAGTTLDVVVHGRGGHGGTPHLAVDPVVTAAAVVLRLQTVVSRECAPAEQVVLTVGSLRAGERANVIPDRAELALSLRAVDDRALDRVRAAVERVVRAECAASGSEDPPDITVTSRAPALTPDPAATAALRRVHGAALGPGRVLTAPLLGAVEDYAHFGAGGVPLAYWLLGTTGARRWREALATGAPLPPNHSPEFAPDVRTALPTGITALTSAALHTLRARPEGAEAPSDPDHAEAPSRTDHAEAPSRPARPEAPSRSTRPEASA